MLYCNSLLYLNLLLTISLVLYIVKINCEQIELIKLLPKLLNIQNETLQLKFKNEQIRKRIHNEMLAYHNLITGCRLDNNNETIIQYKDKSLSQNKTKNVTLKSQIVDENSTKITNESGIPMNSSKFNQQSDCKLSKNNFSKNFTAIRVDTDYVMSNATYGLNRNSTKTTNHQIQNDSERNKIDYNEMQQFNIWVQRNLDYADKNVNITIEDFQEQADSNNGNVDYNEEHIIDALEGLKYWKSTIIFQEKTLNGEKFELDI